VDFFVQTLNSEIKNQPDLKPFVDSRAFEQQVVEQRIGNATLDEMRQLLATIAEYREAQPVQHVHIHSQGGSVIVGDVHAGGNFVGRDSANVDVPAELPDQVRSDPDNPFTDKQRINDPARFFGRQQIVRELQQSLDNGNSIALIGPPGVGKSSLLYYLYTTRAKWLYKTEAIYLDLQGIFGERDLYGEIQKILTPSDVGNPQSNIDALRMLKQTLRTRPTLLILDEVDRLAGRNFKVEELQGLLRSLIQEEQLSLLVACKYEINKIFTPSNPTSPLHNVFVSKLLKNFTCQEANEFINQRLDSTNIRFDDQDIDKLWSDTQGHPGRLQRKAEELFAYKIACR